MRAAGIPHDAPQRPERSTAAFVHRHILPAAAALLPARLDVREARLLIMAIGLQESRFEHRVQVQGPARGFWQFEAGGGVRGVLRHPASRPLIEPVLEVLRVKPEDCYHAIAYNDVLAAVFARLLLWTHAKPLPEFGDVDAAWHYYAVDLWRPGKPHRDTWGPLYVEAMGLVGRAP